jgi:hypothetical protein
MDVLDRASKDADTKQASADPEGGVHGCTPFSDLAMDGESENPVDNDAAWRVLEKAFSLVRFFCALQKK